MKDVSDKNFGVIIAFLLPGFLLLWGLSFSQPEIAIWLANMSSKDAPLIGSFLYATIASLALGLLISAVRETVVDTIFYYLLGLKFPDINSSRLKNKDTLAAFNAIIENHYRYYQYYANSIVAVGAASTSYVSVKGLPSIQIMLLVGTILAILVFVARDQLKSFNERAEDITQ